MLRQRCEIQGMLNIPHKLNGIIYNMSDFKIRGSDVTMKILKIKILLCPEAPLWSDETVKPFFDALMYCRRYVLRSKAKGDEKSRVGDRRSRKSQKPSRNNLRGTFVFYMHKEKR